MHPHPSPSDGGASVGCDGLVTVPEGLDAGGAGVVKEKRGEVGHGRPAGSEGRHGCVLQRLTAARPREAGLEGGGGLPVLPRVVVGVSQLERDVQVVRLQRRRVAVAPRRVLVLVCSGIRSVIAFSARQLSARP
eukprot:1500637-Pyramimonas_sp.AAC.1